jgi:hypothetical protein
MGLQETTSLYDREGGENMDQIIPIIFDEMGSDGENDSQEFVEYYNGASTEQRAAMNYMCIFLCGWSLETIFERCGLIVDATTGAVDV